MRAFSTRSHLSLLLCPSISHLCVVPRADHHKCFIESLRDSSSLRRLCPVVGKESWCSRLHERDTRQRGTRVPVSCTFSIILRAGDQIYASRVDYRISSDLSARCRSEAVWQIIEGLEIVIVSMRSDVAERCKIENYFYSAPSRLHDGSNFEQNNFFLNWCKFLCEERYLYKFKWTLSAWWMPSVVNNE